MTKERIAKIIKRKAGYYFFIDQDGYLCVDKMGFRNKISPIEIRTFKTSFLRYARQIVKQKEGKK